MATENVETASRREVPPTPAGVPIDDLTPVPGASPWALARRRLRRNKVALAFGLLFVLLVLSALAAPLWAGDVADTTLERNRIADTLTVDGEPVQIVDFEGVPTGPLWFGADGQYFLGADRNGRDVMVRLLYGARNSLFIAFIAAAITMLVATLLGLLAGFYRGLTDTVISRALDVVWAFPVILLGAALGTALAIGGLEIGPITIRQNSLWIPALIIGVVNVVYLARPIRGQVLGLREREFVEAARAQGAGNGRIMLSELLPNLASTLLAFFPIIVANSISLEAALSFLGAGVQAPNPSWGTMIRDGLDFLVSRPSLTIAPGAMLALTILALNVFGEGVRDALDPRSKLRLDA